MIDFSISIDFNAEEHHWECEKVFENEEYVVFIDGAVLNEKDLIQSHAVQSIEQLIIRRIQNREWLVCKDWVGEFNGFVYIKEEEKYVVFTNPQATRKVFYYHQEKVGIVIANRVTTITETLRDKKWNYSLAIESAYHLLSVANLLENRTLVNEVKKLYVAEVLEIDLASQKIALHSYFDFKSVEIKKKSLQLHIDEFDELFQKAIAQEYEWDENRQLPSIAFLSGGLDSRMNVFSAIQQNRKIDKVVCFSQEQYLDHRISEQIAKDLHIPYRFIPLQNIDFIKPIDELCALNEYSVYYTGASHVHYALQQVESTPYKSIHSGQIGDGILGNFNTSKKLNPPQPASILKNKRWKEKVMPSLQKVAQNYATEELYFLYNIAFNRAVAGSYVVEEYMHMFSPFLDKEVISYALSIPPEYKYDHRFYFEWMRQKLPKSQKYIWETTALKPIHYRMKKWGTHLVKRAYKYGYIAIGKGNRYTMVPYPYYFEKDEAIRAYFKKQFEEKIGSISAWPELQKDAQIQFEEGNFFEKVLVLTLLSSINQLF